MWRTRREWRRQTTEQRVASETFRTLRGGGGGGDVRQVELRELVGEGAVREHPERRVLERGDAGDVHGGEKGVRQEFLGLERGEAAYLDGVPGDGPATPEDDGVEVDRELEDGDDAGAGQLAAVRQVDVLGMAEGGAAYLQVVQPHEGVEGGRVRQEGVVGEVHAAGEVESDELAAVLGDGRGREDLPGG